MSRAVATFIVHEDRPVDVIQRELQPQGASLLKAEKLVAYISEAFGAACAANMDAKAPVSERYVKWTGSETHEVSLVQEPH